MRALIALAAVSAAFAAQADSLEIYRTIDAQGRVSYTNLKPKHDDYDVLNVEYDAAPRAAIAPSIAPPREVGITPARKHGTQALARPVAATLRVVAFPSLRLAATTGEPQMPRRRKAVAVPALALRMDGVLRSWTAAD